MPPLRSQQPTRDRWRVEMVEQRSEGGLVLFEYAIRETGLDPFLLNNHRAQLRETHQRVVTNAQGDMLHVSGVYVPAADLRAFRAADPRYYRWADKDIAGNWRDDRGRTLAPYLFAAAPWEGGQVEELDPQWVRETYTLSLAAQVQECIGRYQDRAEAGQWTGDRRGTTLNLQVGASAADAQNHSAFSSNQTEDYSGKWDGTAERPGFRFANVTIANAATINTATLQLYATSTGGGVSSVHMKIYGEAADNPGNWASTTHEPGSVSITTAGVDWDPSSWTAGAFRSLPGVASVVQEIVNRAGFVSGNGLAVVIRDDGTVDGNDLGHRTYDAVTSDAAKLDIDYTAGGGQSQAPRTMHQARMKRVA